MWSRGFGKVLFLRLARALLVDRFTFRRYVAWLRSSRLASRPETFRRWLTRRSFAARLRCHSCLSKISLMAQASLNGAILMYDFLPVHCIVDLARLRFVDAENIHQILHICIAQSF